MGRNSLDGMFAPNKISMPQWKNKEGKNDFEMVLNRLVNIGKKVIDFKKKSIDDKNIKKKAEGEEQVIEEQPTFDPATQNKEQTISVENYYDSAPRPLGEVYNNRTVQSERAIYKAREIVGLKLAELELPASEVYLLRTDISRYAGDGTPATGRISFQIPFMTPQGDSRTVYADVDIVLGSLMPPQYFTDGVNQRFAFSQEGVYELLRGRDFEIMSNPKVAPETTYFEAPGHLASRGGEMFTKHGKEEEPVPVGTGTDVAALLDTLEALEKDLEDKKKKLQEADQKLKARVETLPETTDVKQYRMNIKDIKDKEKDWIAKIENIFSQFQTKTMEYQKVLWKLEKKTEEARAPSYKALIGEIINAVNEKIPTIKNIVDKLWNNTRSMTETKSLVRQPELGQSQEWEIDKTVVKPQDSYTPPTGEERKTEFEASVNKRFKKLASVSEDVSEAFKLFGEIDVLMDKLENA